MPGRLSDPVFAVPLPVAGRDVIQHTAMALVVFLDTHHALFFAPVTAYLATSEAYQAQTPVAQTPT